MIKNNLKKIFSISEYPEHRNLIILFGFKIKIPKKHFQDMRAKSPYQNKCNQPRKNSNSNEDKSLWQRT